MGIEVREIDPLHASDALLHDLHEFYVEVDREEVPDDPPMPESQRLAIWRSTPEHQIVRRWCLIEDARIVGAALISMGVDENLDKAYYRLYIGPDHRKRGLSIHLARVLVQAADEAGRTSVVTDAIEGSPWEHWLERVGLKRVLVDKESRLRIDDVDWDLMDTWIQKASERASDYELLSIEAPVPEEHLERWCKLMELMNTAPLEDLEWEDFSMTPKKWRDIEAKDAERGMRLSAEIAVHQPTGDFVGLSELIAMDPQPDLAWQGDTVVHPGHRNLGLGRWLKASMLKRFVESHPLVERIDTGNAGSNEAMLNINIEMGYQPLFTNNAWQGDLADIKKGLALS